MLGLLAARGRRPRRPRLLPGALRERLPARPGAYDARCSTPSRQPRPRSHTPRRRPASRSSTARRPAPGGAREHRRPRRRDGEREAYAKTHMDAKERRVFTPGESFVIAGDRLGLACCYDLAFPEPSRMLALQGARVLLVPMAWEVAAELRARERRGGAGGRERRLPGLRQPVRRRRAVPLPRREPGRRPARRAVVLLAEPTAWRSPTSTSAWSTGSATARTRGPIRCSTTAAPI